MLSESARLQRQRKSDGTRGVAGTQRAASMGRHQSAFCPGPQNTAVLHGHNLFTCAHARAQTVQTRVSRRPLLTQRRLLICHFLWSPTLHPGLLSTFFVGVSQPGYRTVCKRVCARDIGEAKIDVYSFWCDGKDQCDKIILFCYFCPVDSPSSLDRSWYRL